MSTRSIVRELAKPENRYYDLPSDDHVEGRGRGDWLEILDACLDAHDKIDNEDFAGAWVNNRTDYWFPGLSTLKGYGLLEKTDTTRAGQRAYWKLKDPDGVREVLKELNVRD